LPLLQSWWWYCRHGDAITVVAVTVVETLHATSLQQRKNDGQRRTTPENDGKRREINGKRWKTAQTTRKSMQ